MICNLRLRYSYDRPIQIVASFLNNTHRSLKRCETTVAFQPTIIEWPLVVESGISGRCSRNTREERAVQLNWVRGDWVQKNYIRLIK